MATKVLQRVPSRPVCAEALRKICIAWKQTRNTWIMKRKYPLALAKLGEEPKLKRRHKVYEVEENTLCSKLPDIQCILTEDVDGIGIEDELVTVKRKIFRSKLYPAGLALYASPENLAELMKRWKEKGIDGTKPKLSPYAKMTMKQLEAMFLPIPMNAENPWILNKTHVRVAFRRASVEVKDHCITLPDEPITEPQDVEIGLTINGLKRVTVKGRIIPTYKDVSKNTRPPDLPPLFRPTVRLWKLKQQENRTEN